MVTEEIESSAITNRDAVPSTINGAHLEKGVIREIVGTVEMGTADAGSIYRFGQVPSNARISEVLIWCDDVGTAGAADVGVYQTTQNGGAVVDADFFAAAVDLNAAALHGYNATHRNSSGFGIEDAEKRLWDALGLSVDSNRMYDIAMTSTTAAATGGTLTLKVRYVVD